MINKPDRTLLIIAYFFPPLGGIAVHRAVKFARYLPEFGWRPVILTVRNSPFPLRDEALINQLPPDIQIFRAPTIEPAHGYKLFQSIGPKSKKTSMKILSNNGGNHKPKRSFLIRLQNWLFIPDGYIGWAPFALSLGRKLLKQIKPDAIFSTSEPYTSHLIARQFVKKYPVPWIMDLRDPWVTNQFYLPPTHWHFSLVNRLERSCVTLADRVVSVTPSLTDEMCQRYPDQDQTKFITLTNGFDSDDFDASVRPDPKCFSIRHVGSMYGGRNVLLFLEGLLLALKHEPNLQNCLQIEFIGDMNQSNQQAWDTFVTTHTLQKQLTRRSFIPHGQAVRLMQQSHVQLLILGDGHNLSRVYTGKLLEYLGTGRPILAMAPSDTTIPLINELEAGVVVNHNDPQAVANAILTYYQWFQRGDLENWSSKGAEIFERRSITQQLASQLDQLI
ncbi:MAG: glycosyltransferase [Chloroflexota bacterium]